MWKSFLPDQIVNNVREIDFAAEKARGITAVIFDIDNTLVPHDAPATEETVAFFEMLRELGLKPCLISNNHEARVKPFAEKVGSLYHFDAGKPLRKAYRNTMKILGTTEKETLFVGDQLLTDIFGARRCGLRNILTRPVDPSTDIPRVRFKRKIEKTILKHYHGEK